MGRGSVARGLSRRARHAPAALAPREARAVSSHRSPYKTACCGWGAASGPLKGGVFAAWPAAALATDSPHSLRRRRREPGASGAAARTGTGGRDSPLSPASAGHRETVTSRNGYAVSEPAGAGIRSPDRPLPTACAPGRQGLAPAEPCMACAEVNTCSLGGRRLPRAGCRGGGTL